MWSIARLGAVIALTVPASAQAASPGLDVDPGRLPPIGTEQVAQYGDHLTWVQKLPDRAGRPVDMVLDRVHGRTLVLPIAPVRDLDLGPGPGGRPLAVYVRCRPSCDVWRYDFFRLRESLVRSVSAAGVSERLPSVWGDRIAYRRGSAIRVADLRRHTTRTVARAEFVEDLELGAKQLAYVGPLSENIGNGGSELRLRGLASRRERVLDEGVIGEGSSRAFGALTFLGRELFWQTHARDGCTILAPKFAVYDVRRGKARDVASGQAPVAVRRAAVIPPETPESEGCDKP